MQRHIRYKHHDCYLEFGIWRQANKPTLYILLISVIIQTEDVMNSQPCLTKKLPRCFLPGIISTLKLIFRIHRYDSVVKDVANKPDNLNSMPGNHMKKGERQLLWTPICQHKLCHAHIHTYMYTYTHLHSILYNKCW